MRQIKGSTNNTGLIGNPVAHSISPIIHNYAFELLDIDMNYIAMSVKPSDLEAAILGIRALNFTGINVSLPHKETIIPYIDEISETAAVLGAVNTLYWNNNKLVGENTDSDGFINSWKEEVQVDLKNKNVFIIGAGGSARAVYYALCKENVNHITILARNEKRAQAVHENFNNYFPSLKRSIIHIYDRSTLNEKLAYCDVLINCSPIGMSPSNNTTPVVLPDSIRESIIIYDLIYNPPLTYLLLTGKKASLKTYNGLGMLLHQAALSFQIWTDKIFPMKLVKKYIQEYLNL